MTSENKISYALSAADKADILLKLAEIKAKLSFMINLTIGDRRKYRKMGHKSLGYVQDCLRGAQAFPNVLPPSINVEEFAKDLALWNDLNDLLVAANALVEGLIDTIMAAGSDAMTTSDLVYGYLKQGAKQDANLKTLIESIGQHYKKSTKKVTDKPT